MISLKQYNVTHPNLFVRYTLTLTLVCGSLITGAYGENTINCPEKIAPIKAPFAMPELSLPSFPDRDFVITKFGAQEGGQVLITDAIKKTIAACHQSGGGRVIIPSGIWMTGPIHLKSNVNLHLKDGAELRFHDDPDLYLPLVLTRFEGFECYNYSPLIYANGCHHIGITGKGKLVGNGEKWWPWKLKRTQHKHVRKLNQMCADGVPVKDRKFGIKGGLRPSFVQPFRCTNVLIEGVTIENGPFWTVHPVYCEKIIVRGISIYTNGPNTDGVNLDSCKYGLVEHCYFSTGDDSVSLKSGINEDGWRVNKPCEYIVIRHCQTEAGHGGVVIGSEMSGGVQYIFAHDMDIKKNDKAIRIKSMRGRGGFVKNVYFENFRVGVVRDAVIQINMKYSASSVKPLGNKAPVFENIFIKNITCDKAKIGYRVIGLKEQSIKNVSLENITIKKAENESSVSCVDGLKLTNVHINGRPNVVIVGDSTVSKYSGVKAKTQQGWGYAIHENPAFKNIKVVNLAIGGSSSKSFIDEGRWKRALSEKGKYYLIQFGHNDQKKDEKRRTEPDGAYRANLKKFIKDVRAIGAVPVMVTPPVRGLFKNGQLHEITEPVKGVPLTQPLGEYAKAMRKLAKEENLACLDLYTESGKLITSLGEDKLLEVYVSSTDLSHFSPKGAATIADILVKEIENKCPDLIK